MSFHKNNPAILLSFYLVVSLIILGFDIDTRVKSVKDFLLYAIVSPYSKINYLASSAINIRSNTRELINAHQNLLEVKKENQRLEYDKARLKTLETENNRLRELLGYKKNIKGKAVLAHIIAKPPQQYYKSMIIDKGSSSGLSAGSPVLGIYNGKFGAVGSLTDVGENVSTIIVLTNRFSNISARIISNNVDGLVVGSNSSQLEMIWLPSDADIKIGATVVSSPVSEIFPAGTPIGFIIAVEESRYLPFKTAKIKPFIPAFQLSEVFVE